MPIIIIITIWILFHIMGTLLKTWYDYTWGTNVRFRTKWMASYKNIGICIGVKGTYEVHMTYPTIIVILPFVHMIYACTPYCW